MLWRRERVLDLFGFDYRWEINLPAAKRRFGPYTMPVLEGDRFVARLDTRTDRAAGLLVVERLHIEPQVEPTPARMRRIRRAVEELARDVGVSRVDWGR